MKRNIIIVLSILIFILSALGLYLMKNYNPMPDKNPNPYSIMTNAIGPSDVVKIDNDQRINVAEKIKAAKVQGGFKISNMRISSKINTPEYATIKFDFHNGTSQSLNNFWISVQFIDFTGVSLNSLIFDVESIEAGETISIESKTKDRIIDSYEYKFMKVDKIVGVG